MEHAALVVAVGRVVGDRLGGGAVAGPTGRRPPVHPSAAAVDVTASREQPLKAQEPNTPLPVAVAGVAS